MQENTKSSVPKSAATAANRHEEAVTIKWVFEAHKAYQYTFDEILSLVDGLDRHKLYAAFRDAHVDGGMFAQWFSRQSPPPCTLRPTLVAFICKRLAAIGKTVQSLDNPQLFIFHTLRQYWASAARLADELQAEKKRTERSYFEILCRYDHHAPGDAEELVRLLKILSITAGNFQRDLGIVRDAQRFAKLDAELRRLQEAGDRLRELAKLRPEFFDKGLTPRLIVVPSGRQERRAAVGPTRAAAAEIPAQEQDLPLDSVDDSPRQ